MSFIDFLWVYFVYLLEYGSKLATAYIFQVKLQGLSDYRLLKYKLILQDRG